MTNNNISFKAINISNTKFLNHNMSLYRITENDKPFLKKYKDNLDIKNLLPKLNIQDSFIYSSLVEQSLAKAIEKDSKSILIACDKKPCGILVDSDLKDSKYVNFVSTWPISKDTKAPFACKILFLQLFNDFLKTDKQSIELGATRFGKAISKYIQLGFKMCGGDNYIEKMKITRENIEKKLNILNKDIKLFETNNNTNIDLSKELKY